jgi:hypothetical protein
MYFFFSPSIIIIIIIFLFVHWFHFFFPWNFFSFFIRLFISPSSFLGPDWLAFFHFLLYSGRLVHSCPAPSSHFSDAQPTMSADNNTNKLPPISAFSHEDEHQQKPLGFKPTLLTVPSSQNHTSSQYPYATSPNTSSEHLPSLASPYYYSQTVASGTNSSGLNGPVSTARRSPSPYFEKPKGSLAGDDSASKQTDFHK